MTVPLVAVATEALELAALMHAVLAQGSGDGPNVSVARLVRDHHQGRRVGFLEFDPCEPLAVTAMRRIVAEARAAWPSAVLGLHHRTGRLDIGEASIIIVAASAHRADAFAASRYAI